MFSLLSRRQDLSSMSEQTEPERQCCGRYAWCRDVTTHAPTVIIIAIIAAQHLAGNEQCRHHGPDGEHQLRHSKSLTLPLDVSSPT